MASEEHAGVERICIAGLGCVGCVTAAGLAHFGHRVTGVDTDAAVVRGLFTGHAPLREPDLDELVREGLFSGRLSFSTNIRDGLRGAAVVLVCVGTPSGADGAPQLGQLRSVMAQIREALEGIDTASKRRLIVAVRSTVLPGTCEGVLGPILGRSGAILVSNPEFLREGNAVRDFLEPPLVVAGSADTPAAWRVARLYSASSARPCLVSLRTAEMVKCASNAFHALKIAFANEIGALCAASGTSGTEVMEILCRDRKLSISASYLRPGFAFGGSCLPKELRGLEHQARDAGLELPLLRSILPSNREHLDRAINAALALPEGRIGVIGVSFKPDTDDVRESPAVRLLEALIENHRQVRAFDPQIRLDRLRKSSSRLLLSRIPSIEEVLVPELPELLGWAHRLVLTRRPRSEHAKLIRESGLPVLDLAHALLVEETGPGEAGDTRGVEEVGARRAR